jgi:ankyrin repeat protein
MVGSEYGTPLQVVCFNSYRLAFDLLIRLGANVNKEGGKYGVPVNAAIAGGQTAMARLLILRGVEHTLKDPMGRTPLFTAAKNSNVEIASLLIEAGADIAVANNNGWTPLNSASENGHLEVVKFLIEKGANPNVQGGPYGNAFQVASYKGHEMILKLLLENGVDSDAGDKNIHSWTPLHLAARGDNIRTFQFLVNLGLDLSALDAKGDGVLCYASSGGSLDTLQAALDLGLTSSLENTHWSPLHWACRSGKLEVVELLIKEGLRGEYVLIPEPQGEWSPLDIAIFHGHEKMLEKLSPNCRALLGSENHNTRPQGKCHGSYWCSGCFHVSE